MELQTQQNTEVDLFSAVVGIVAFGGFWALHEKEIIWLFVFGAVALLVLLIHILRHTVFKTNEILESDICKKLDKSGFHHEIKDGVLYISKDDCHFRVHINDSFNKRIKNFYVLYEFVDDDFSKVSMDG